MTAQFQDPAAEHEAARLELDAVRERILAAPGALLEDPEIMEALLREGEVDGRKVVDLRGAQVGRLESQLQKLRQAHRDVVEAALDSMNGVEQAHQAALALMETDCAESLAARVRGRLPSLLNIDDARLCLCLDDPSIGATRRALISPADGEKERAPTTSPWLNRMLRRAGAFFERSAEASLPRSDVDRDALDPALVLLPSETLMSRCPRPLRRPSARRRLSGPGPGRPVAVSVRDIEKADRALFGVAADRLEKVATLTLDLSPARNVGALAFGVGDGDKLRNSHLIEQMAFLGGVVERLIRSDDEIDARLLSALGAPEGDPGLMLADLPGSLR